MPCNIVSVAQGALTIAVRYGAARQQFGPPDAPEVAVLDYQTQQGRLMPMLATAYTLHFAVRFLVHQYIEAKHTKEDELVADVHALSAGEGPLRFVCLSAHDCARGGCSMLVTFLMPAY